MRFLPLDKLINVQEGYRKRFKIDSTDLILSKENDQILPLVPSVLTKNNHWKKGK